MYLVRVTSGWLGCWVFWRVCTPQNCEELVLPYIRIYIICIYHVVLSVICQIVCSRKENVYVRSDNKDYVFYIL